MVPRVFVCVYDMQGLRWVYGVGRVPLCRYITEEKDWWGFGMEDWMAGEFRLMLGGAVYGTGTVLYTTGGRFPG